MTLISIHFFLGVDIYYVYECYHYVVLYRLFIHFNFTGLRTVWNFLLLLNNTKLTRIQTGKNINVITM